MSVYEKVSQWTKDHPVTAAVVGVAGAVGLIYFPLNQGAYDSIGWQHPTTRFLYYVPSAHICGKMNVQRVKNQKGRELTPREEITSYLYGTLTSGILWEGWEGLGSSDFIHQYLHNLFGDVAKQDFVGKFSFRDLGLTTGLSFAFESAKEEAKKLWNYFNPKGL